MTGNQWSGYFYDGKSAKKHDCVISIISDYLEINYSNKTEKWYFRDIYKISELQSNEQTHLKNNKNTDQRLVIDEPYFIDQIGNNIPGSKKFNNYGLNYKSLRILAIICAILIPLYLLGYFFFILPVTSEFIANHIPVSFEKTLAKPYYRIIVDDDSSCNEQPGFKEINHIFNILKSTIPETRYDLRLHLIKSDIINAFALPGGDIILYSGLLKKTTRPEQLAGVLAHEIQHITNRHGTESLIKDYSLSILISAMTGNTNNSNSTLGIAKFIGLLKNSRENESEADNEGLKMLRQANIDPKGMVEFFEIIKEITGDIPGSIKYISTHPQTAERIKYLENEISKTTYESRTIYSIKKWEELRKICDTESIKEFKLF